MEARGEVRGGRFVQGFHGEQFALPEAVESMRATRDLQHEELLTLAACDAVNLIGVVIPGERTSAVAGKRVHLRNGMACDAEGNSLDAVATPQGIRRNPFSREEASRPQTLPQESLFA